MRQLKQFMRNRKKEMLACGPCECRTLQCWRYANENCGCGDISTGDMVQYVLNWFQSTPVFADLTPEQQEQALQDAQTILEGAGEGIAPFYQAVQQGRTFANYVKQLGLTVDETGPCDSSLYEDNEAFIVYISAAGAIDCKYLALVATRGLTSNQELVNKDEIAAYFDWLTTSDVTYTFKDWDGEILKVGTVEKGETPIAPSDPTRTGYRFIGWTPAITTVTEDVTYVATYVEQFDVTITANNTDYGTVNVSELTVDNGTAISAEGNVLTIGDTEVTATANTGYVFSTWVEGRFGDPLPATVTGALSVMAVFEAEPVIIPNNIATTYDGNGTGLDLFVDGDSKIEIILGQSELSIVPSGKYIDKGIDTVLASIEPLTLLGSLVTCEAGEDAEGIWYSTIDFVATGVFDSEFMELVQTLYDSYSEENATALKTYIESKSVTMDEGATEMVSWNLVKITAAVNNSDYGTTNVLWLNVTPGVEPVINEMQVEFPTFGDGISIINVTPNAGYKLNRWDNVPEVVTGDTTITAILEDDGR